MKIDKKTLEDLSIIDKNGGVLQLLDHCLTSGGSQLLRQNVQLPINEFDELLDTQQAVRDSMPLADQWPVELNNGMVLMVEKFFSAREAHISKPNNVTVVIDKIVQKLFPRNEQAVIKFTIHQVIDFMKACHQIVQLYQSHIKSRKLQTIIRAMDDILSQSYVKDMVQMPSENSHKTLMLVAYNTRMYTKTFCKQMIELLYELDYYRALAIATQSQGWTMPEFLSTYQHFEAEGLYHPLVKEAVSYNVHLTSEQNFIFITGANMSGKSTYMKSIGIAAYLAHLGCGVPAQALRLGFIHALVTNMHIQDNIYTGESYFLAEVMRMKNTALQLKEQDNNLVLMDELFKGTNIYDAYECSETVVKSLVNNNKNIYCLSTHLYELGHQLQVHHNIQFQYFETILTPDGHYAFTYQLKEGVSNDKIGYMVLKKEGVVDILNDI